VQYVQEQLVSQPDRRPALEEEKATLARRVRRMVEAIGDGQGPAALVQEIAKAEARIQAIEAELAGLRAVPTLGQVDLGRIQREVTRGLARFEDLLRGDVPHARQALKTILVNRVKFSPMDTADGRRTYSFEGELVYNGIVLQGLAAGIHATRPPNDPNPLVHGQAGFVALSQAPILQTGRLRSRTAFERQRIVGNAQRHHFSPHVGNFSPLHKLFFVKPEAVSVTENSCYSS